MKAKRIVALLMAAILSAGLLAGCGNKKEAGDNSGDNQGNSGELSVGDEKNSKYAVTDPVTIEFWYNGASDTEMYDAWIEDFNSSQNMVTVVGVCQGDYSTITDKMAAARAAKSGLPGVCVINNENFYAYADSGMMEPLADYCEDYGFDTDNLVDGFYDFGCYQGTFYGMPNGVSVGVFFYNKTAMEAAGISEFPTTWAEFKTYCETMYKATGKPAYTCASAQNNILYNFATNWGGTLINDDGVTTGFDSETLQGYVKEIKEMVDKGWIEWSLEGVSPIANKFLAGDTMCVNISCTSYDGYINDDFEVGVAWNYMAEKNISNIAGAVAFIPSDLTQNEKNGAFQWLMYINTEDKRLEHAKKTSYLVTLESVIEDDSMMAEIYEMLPGMKVVYDNMDKYVPKPESVYFSSTMKQFCNSVNLIILEGYDFDKEWKNMVDNINYILAGN